MGNYPAGSFPEDSHLAEGNYHLAEDSHPAEGNHLAKDIHHLGAVEDIEAGPLGSIVALTSLYPDLATISFS